MTKKWIGINLLLLLMTIAAVWQLHNSIQQFKAGHDLSKIQPDGSLTQKTAQDTILPPPYVSGHYNLSNFNIISEKNVFSESRNTESSADATIPTGMMPASLKPSLVGVIISGSQKIASILEPQGRGRSTQALLKRIGDVYEGYTLTEIEPDHIVLDNGNQKEIIYLSDSVPQNRRTGTSTVSTRVIPIGNSAAGSDNQVTVVSKRAGSARPTPIRSTPQPANSGTAETARGIILQGGFQPTGQQPEPQTPGATNVQQPAATTQVPAPPATQGGSRVIRTPFGDIIRDP